LLFEKFRDRSAWRSWTHRLHEALHIFLSTGPARRSAGTTGVPVPGYEVEIRDESEALPTLVICT